MLRYVARQDRRARRQAQQTTRPWSKARLRVSRRTVISVVTVPERGTSCQELLIRLALSYFSTIFRLDRWRIVEPAEVLGEAGDLADHQGRRRADALVGGEVGQRRKGAQQGALAGSGGPLHHQRRLVAWPPAAPLIPAAAVRRPSAAPACPRRWLHGRGRGWSRRHGWRSPPRSWPPGPAG